MPEPTLSCSSHAAGGFHAGYSPPIVGVQPTIWLSVAVAIVAVVVIVYLTSRRRGSCLNDWVKVAAEAASAEEEELRFGGSAHGLADGASVCGCRHAADEVALGAAVFGGRQVVTEELTSAEEAVVSPTTLAEVRRIADSAAAELQTGEMAAADKAAVGDPDGGTGHPGPWAVWADWADWAM